MRLLAIGAAAMVAVGSASAQCYTFGSSTTCFDAKSGNSYTTYRSEGYSSTYGSNMRTGSRWSQQSYSYGQTESGYGNTQTFGTASDGSRWQMQQYRTPYGSSVSGYDSDGSYFSDWYGY